MGFDGSGKGVFARRFDDVPPAACAPVPKTGCRRQTRDGVGVFRFHQAPDPARSTLNWRWIRGERTTVPDLGDPVHCVGDALCVYDASGNAQPLVAALAPAADVCGTKPCWHELSGATRPVEYFDNPLENSGGPTNPDDIRRLRLKPGDDTKARISAQLRGVNLSLPATPLTPPVVVQLQAASGERWTGTYDAFVRKNDDGRFVAQEGSASGAFLD